MKVKPVDGGGPWPVVEGTLHSPVDGVGARHYRTSPPIIIALLYLLHSMNVTTVIGYCRYATLSCHGSYYGRVFTCLVEVL